MKKSTLVIGIIQVVFGLFFAVSIASDIQFGFAVVLLTIGTLNIFNSKKNV